MFISQAYAQIQDHSAGDAPLGSELVAPTPEAVFLEGQEVHESGGFPPLETEFFASQILWLAIFFGLLYLILAKTIVPRLAGIIEGRRGRIAADLEAAERMRVDADEARAAYEQELTEARERAHAIGHTARDEARQSADEERRRNEAELDGKLEKAQAHIADVKAKALADVGTIAEDAAEAILSELTGNDVSREDVANAVRSAR
ncbi:F0F1 ATP synthase subunit B [Aureimonas fodinaquatilis]|uniref:ATP synthase subunit b n=1 Tax=Aureimonas fodinaquatilis TaxID=2565783 RepID=A0A5B0E3U1_9HYPH|nr:F0F1 ATP synthase subunit B [Aureimonas fodinaquatilis]KAA0972440.1 F0F1 ATP synthase subunit B [Aureimonas fodinaquatilis]